ncbi:MAG: Propionate--CoA ligase (EC [uncultured Caballeronia sp.]|nr:MAG: Propionate--CoA ligase (EC [uncultured Caballeronia sp.]
MQRDVGGYAVALAASMQHIFQGNPGDTMWTASDVGWVVEQLHHLCAADCRPDDGHVRRHADSPRWRHLVADHRAAQD